MDQQIISRYIGQPSSLPIELREHLAREWEGGAVQLYAYIDLDASLKLGEAWLVLGATHITLLRTNAFGDVDVLSVARDRITTVQETPGLSANTLMLLGEDDERQPAEAPL